MNQSALRAHGLLDVARQGRGAVEHHLYGRGWHKLNVMRLLGAPDQIAKVIDLETRRRALRVDVSGMHPDRARSLRAWTDPSVTLPRASKRRLALVGRSIDYESERPRTRSECVGQPRPCPFVSCKYHLALDVAENGNVKINFPALFGADDAAKQFLATGHGEPPEMDLEILDDTCVLDVADRGGLSIDSVADRMNLTRARACQIEHDAVAKLRDIEELKEHS